MFSLSIIHEMNRKAGRRAKSLRLVPVKVQTKEELRNIPSIGNLSPKGFIRTNTYFVDSSGFGVSGELALTFNQIFSCIKPDRYYAIIEAGQFQLYIGEYFKEERKK